MRMNHVRWQQLSSVGSWAREGQSGRANSGGVEEEEEEGVGGSQPLLGPFIMQGLLR